MRPFDIDSVVVSATLVPDPKHGASDALVLTVEPVELGWELGSRKVTTREKDPKTGADVERPGVLVQNQETVRLVHTDHTWHPHGYGLYLRACESPKPSA